MRIPSLPVLVRTINRLSSSSTRIPQNYKALKPLTTGTVLKSMPAIPFLSSFFGTTSSSPKMSYPVQKTDDEWRAVLSKGMSTPHIHTQQFTIP